MRSAAASIRSRVTSSWRRWSAPTAIGAAPAGSRATLALQRSRGLARCRRHFVKTHSYGEFVFDFAWAQAYAQLGRHYYPKLTLAAPFTPGDRPATARAARTRRRRRSRRAARRARATREAARHSRGCMRCSSMSRASASSGRLAAAARLPVPLEQPRLRRASRPTSRPSPPRSARRPARAPPGAEAGVASRRASAASSMTTPWTRLRAAPRHVPAPRHEPYLTPRFLQRGRAHAARSADGEARVHSGEPWRSRSSSGAGRALRPLLGRRRRVPQPAFRGLLSPGHRVLHRARHAPLRARDPGRAQGDARLRADAHLVGPLHRRPALRRRDR